MLNRLERDFIAADLAAVEGMIALHSDDVDSIGYVQFTKRKKRLEQQLQELSVPVANQFEIGLYFKGPPVENDVGATADFVSKVIDLFNALVIQTSTRQQAKLFVSITQQRMMGFVLEACAEDLRAGTHLRALDLLQTLPPDSPPQLDNLLDLIREYRVTMQVRCDEREFMVSQVCVQPENR